MPKITNYGGATNGVPEPVETDTAPEPSVPDKPAVDPETFSQLRSLFS